MARIMKKVVVTGTGRCGTSFLMHLFTCLGMDTGFTPDECVEHLKRSGCNGGIEHGYDSESRIVKNPDYLRNYDKVKESYDVDYFIVPIRDLEAVARSRESNQGYGGFLKGAKNYLQQLEMHKIDLHSFLQTVLDNEDKMIMLYFPRIVEDKYYLYNSLSELMNEYNIGLPFFEETFEKIADPDKVHF